MLKNVKRFVLFSKDHNIEILNPDFLVVAKNASSEF